MTAPVQVDKQAERDIGYSACLNDVVAALNNAIDSCCQRRREMEARGQYDIHTMAWNYKAAICTHLAEEFRQQLKMRQGKDVTPVADRNRTFPNAPDPLIYAAKAVLDTLRQWKAASDQTMSTFTVFGRDIDYLESWALGLANSYRKHAGWLLRHGYAMPIAQPYVRIPSEINEQIDKLIASELRAAEGYLIRNPAALSVPAPANRAVSDRWDKMMTSDAASNGLRDQEVSASLVTSTDDGWTQGLRFSRDGNRWCCVGLNFINLQESPAGFGDTMDEAHTDLMREMAKEDMARHI